MSEENENKPTESSSETSAESTASSSDIETQVAQIEELIGKIRLLRWGLFIGVLAIMAIGISSIWNTTKKAAEPAVEVYKEAKDVYESVQAKFDAAQRDYNRIEPKVTKVYNTAKGLLNRDSKEWQKLRSEFKDNMAEKIEPAAKVFVKEVLIDIQDEALEKFDEISNQSEEFLSMTRDEYEKVTNNVPKVIGTALEQTLLKAINEREARMREMFPKLTKEKQKKVISRLSNFTEKETEKIFIALFADHLSELGKMKDSMDAIYAKEAVAIVNKKTGVETTLALLSSLIEIAAGEFDTKNHWKGTLENDPKEKDSKPKDESTPPAKEKKPEPEKKKKAVKKRKPAKGKKVEPKKEDTSSDNQ